MVEPGVVTAREADVLRTFARRIDAADPGAHNNLGVLYFRRGLVDEAIEGHRLRTKRVHGPGVSGEVVIGVGFGQPAQDEFLRPEGGFDLRQSPFRSHERLIASSIDGSTTPDGATSTRR